MSYRLEKKDIVISGMENGIADSPYNGIADMRNINILTVPGEGSVQYREVPAVLPPTLNNIPFTASASTNRLTWAGPDTGLYEGVAISLSFGNEADVLVVAGGGGGGGGGAAQNSGGGGGGAGGVIETTMSFASGTYPIVIGTGGGGGNGGNPGIVGTNGVDTTFNGETAVGGGAGAGANNAVAPATVGGSGGGGGQGDQSTGAAGTVGQGNAGGDGSSGGGGGDKGGGGGGGSDTIGQDSQGITGGAGGDGISSSISGSAVNYGGGGGAGSFSSNAGGAGGSGGGGTGGGSGGAATAGTANRGGGGGGGRGGTSTNGAAGSTGIVVVSYPTGSITATGGTVTTAGGNTIHTFTTSADFVVTTGDLSPDTVYYVRNIVGLTFQLSLAPAGNIFDITADTVGTFTTYTYGNQRGLGSSDKVPPIAYVVDRAAENGVTNGIYMTDLSNYIWGIFPIDIPTTNILANHLIFMGNIGGVAASSLIFSGLNIWKGYLFIFGLDGGVDVADLETLFVTDGPTAEWDYDWWNASNANVNSNQEIDTLVGQDDTLYYISRTGVGSILENSNEVFDPSDSSTYERTTTALTIPQFDRSTCLGQLGTNLLIGGRSSFIYPWDRVSPDSNYPLIVPDSNIVQIIGTNQNAYIFAGNRGRIYITNGSAIDEYKKISDYVTGTINPYYRWRDASFARNQLYFTFSATTNADAELTTVNGAWAVDLKKDAMYMVNKITNAGYSGATAMAVEMPAASVVDNPAGTSMVLGWRVSNTYGIDVGSSEPYTSGEAFIDFDMIPIGTIFNTFTPSQFEWKVSQPLGGNGTAETIALYYRTNLTDAFVLLGTTTLTGPTAATVALSDLYQTNFQKAQWLQLRLVSTSNATTPTFNRFYEIRIREYTP